MLAQLAIRDIVLIDRLDLRFPAGLSVLTGETGAGKSILLDAFGLALGGRGDGSLVRHGESQGQVTAVFDAPASHPARALAQAADLDAEGDLILRRVQYADGRTRAFLNDQPIGVQALRAIGATLVEIHGQHDDRALVDPASHRAILDAFAGLQAESQETAAAAQTLRRAVATRDEQAALVARALKESDYLRHSVGELADLDPKPGEEGLLAERRQAMMQAEKIALDLTDVAETLDGPNAAISTLAAALRKLQRRAQQAPAIADPCVKALDAAVTSLEEARGVLEQALRAADFDPREMEKVEERLFALRAAARKYAALPDDLAAVRERLAGELAALEAGETELAAAERRVVEAESAYVAAAARLSKGRQAAGARLEEAVSAELPPLRLERARFSARIETDPASRDAAGFDRVEFWAQTNPGTRAGPLMRIASGGELSRFILALKVVLADKGSAPTLIFDEVDTGVGGAVSDAIGQRLARLAGRVQVVAVTHAPQVAARAASHFLIAKEALDDSERVATRVTALTAAPRREEIARMLAGATVTKEARAAAARLLEGAA